MSIDLFTGTLEIQSDIPKCAKLQKIVKLIAEVKCFFFFVGM